MGLGRFPLAGAFWIFKWPSELSSYLKRQGRVNIISGGAIGAMLLLSLLLRFVDGAVGMALLTYRSLEGRDEIFLAKQNTDNSDSDFSLRSDVRWICTNTAAEPQATNAHEKSCSAVSAGWY